MDFHTHMQDIIEIEFLDVSSAYKIAFLKQEFSLCSGSINLYIYVTSAITRQGNFVFES